MTKFCSSTLAVLMLIQSTAFASMSAGGGLPHESNTGPAREVTAMIMVPGEQGGCALTAADAERLLKSSIRDAAGGEIVVKQPAGPVCPESMVHGVAEAMPANMPVVQNKEASLALGAYAGACLLIGAAQAYSVPNDETPINAHIRAQYGVVAAGVASTLNFVCLPAYAVGGAAAIVGGLVYFSFTKASRHN